MAKLHWKNKNKEDENKEEINEVLEEEEKEIEDF